jgi:hypothetical protein
MSDEWCVGPLWVRPLVAGRWSLVIEDWPTGQRSKTIGFIVRVGNTFEVTTVSAPLTASSFGSLLSAIDFITVTRPAWGDALGAAWTSVSALEAGADNSDSGPQPVTAQ